jgi:hypothetical protein
MLILNKLSQLLSFGATNTILNAIAFEDPSVKTLMHATLDPT